MSGDFHFPNSSYGYEEMSRWYEFEDWAEYPPALQGIIIGFIAIIGLASLVLLVLQIVGMVKTFKKAHQPGWAAIVPVYNIYTIVKIIGLEFWWFVLLIILPTCSWFPASWLGYIALFGLLNYKIAESFGKKIGFAIGLTLIPPIFWMMLGYSQTIKYKGPAGPYKIKYPETPKK